MTAGRALLTRINRLRMACAVLHLGAHPDDEDTGMVAYLTHRVGARVVYWSATRGEGGQNRRGSDKGEALGIVRTWESLDARAFDGGEVLFGPFRDFGFSKSGDQTLRYWGRDDLVREIVRAIRMVQPVLVIARWNGDERDGHGHHQAVGLVAGEAFRAAADPARYRELEEYGLAAWRAKALYRSVTGDWQPGEPGEFGRRDEDYEKPGYVRINSGTYDQGLGCSYQERAASSLNCHASQGMGFVPSAGAFFHYFRQDQQPTQPYAEEFFGDMDPTLTGLADDPGDGSSTLRSALASVKQSAEAAAEAFRLQDPAAASLPLMHGLSALRDLLRRVDPGTSLGRYLDGRRLDFESVLGACLGLRAEFLVAWPRFTPGCRVCAVVRVWNGASDRATIVSHELHLPAGWTATRRPDSATTSDRGALFEAQYEVVAPPAVSPTTPYWLRMPSSPYRYQWPRTDVAGQPFDPPLLHASVMVALGSCRFELRAAACCRDGVPGGWRELPVSVLPSIEIVPRRRSELFPRDRPDRLLPLDATVQCVVDAGAHAAIRLSVPDGFVVEPKSAELTFSKRGEVRHVRFNVHVPGDAEAGTHLLRFTDIGGSTSIESRPVRIGSRGAIGTTDETNCAREMFCAEPAIVRLHVIDADVFPESKIGYVTGLEEAIVPSLANFGLDVAMLDDEALSAGEFRAFDTIVIGPNAYLMRNALRKSRGTLLDFVHQGGVLIAQYQGYGFSPDCTPYPFSYTTPHDRVTMPEAPVEMLDPAHPVFNSPNRISPGDFDNWITDRGLYFFGEWDRRYTPLLASQDKGESPKLGGLLVAPYGRGIFVYAAYSFFRQIPAGVPGAVRLFVNLLGLAEARIRQRMDFLRSTDLLASISDAQCYEIARVTYERSIEQGTYLALEGDAGSDLFIPVDGTIEVIKQGATGHVVVHRARRGDAIGEFAMLANIPRSASLRAASNVTVLVLPGDAFKQLLRMSPELSLRVMDMLVKKIIATNEQGASAG